MEDKELNAVEGDADSNEDQPSEELNNKASEEEEETEPEEKPETEDKEGAEEPEEVDELDKPYYSKRAFTDAVKKESQSLKDKELKGLYSEKKALQARITELEDKQDDKANDFLFADETETYGEEKALTAKEARDQILARRKELRHLEELNKSIPNITAGLIEREKKLQAHNLGYEHFPVADNGVLTDAIAVLSKDDSNSELVSRLQAVATSQKVRADFIDKLLESESESPKDMKLLARALSAELKIKTVKKVTHKPDTSRVAGGGVDLSSLTADELIERGEKKAKYR